MKDKELLIPHIDELHTTPLGVERIKRNLKFDSNDVVNYIKSLILEKNCIVYKKGKNFYCQFNQILITVNANSYTVITAHIL